MNEELALLQQLAEMREAGTATASEEDALLARIAEAWDAGVAAVISPA